MRSVCRFPRRFVRCLSVVVCLALVASTFFLTPLASFNSHAQSPSAQRQNDKVRKVPPGPPEKGAPAIELPNLNEVRRKEAFAPQIRPAVPSNERSKKKPAPENRSTTPAGPTEPVLPAMSRPPLRQAVSSRTAAKDVTRLHHAVTRVVPNPPPLVADITDRIDPSNQPGGGLFTRDANWSLPILNLPGRTGLDLGLSLSYSSMVWTKSGGQIFFDNDDGNPSPGFRLGFPTLQGPFFDPVAGTNAYLLLTSSGHRVELRQTGTSNVFEAADASNLQLIANNAEATWANAGGVTVNGNNLTATSAGWGSAGAASNQTIATGDGYVEFTASETTTYRMIGLSHGDTNRDYADIDFAIFLTPNAGLYVYEGGTWRGYFGAYATGDLLRVAVEGGVVKYRRNGTVFYTSAVAPAYPLLVDTALYDPGSTLTNVKVANLVLRSADGTQVSYAQFGSNWQATQLKDRNGNYLTVDNNGHGDIQTIIDTLGRVIHFNYDGNANLNSITQDWNGSTHYWATFDWSPSLTLNVSGFTGLSVVGASNGSIPVLREVGLPDGSYYQFDYSSVGQVTTIIRYTGDDVARSSIAYVYDYASADCPRLTQTRVWARNWTGVNGLPNEAVTQYDLPGDGSHQVTMPDGSRYKEFYGTGWLKGLVFQTEVWSGSTLQKWTTSEWHQENENVSYRTNPRVTETNIYDANGNRRRTKIGYNSQTLPIDVYEYDANATTILRRTHTDYTPDGLSNYTDRHIIGLPSATYVCNGAQGETPCNDTSGTSLKAKTVYKYDEGSISDQGEPVRHNPEYGSGFQWRGNLTSTRRYNVDNLSQYTSSSLQYNTAGSVILVSDASGHATQISYLDSFSDNTNHNTLAYPTKVKDPDWDASTAPNNYSTLQYDYNFGGRTRLQGPPPAGQSQGVIQSFIYDAAGRLQLATTENTGARTRFNYGPYYVQTWTSVNTAEDSYSIQTFDGLGRVVGAASDHPGSVGGFRGQTIQYDLMGRAKKQYNPTEMNTAWEAVGDDTYNSQTDTGGWRFTTQTYDWKGRPLETTNQDGTIKYASYTGCGCSGGEVVTLTDERGRQQKIYSDVLGRQWKTEVLNWNGSVYSTTTNTFNTLDQVTNARQYQGLVSSGVYQEETKTYDSYGRLASRKAPIQTSATTFTYYPNDKPQTMTDARGATTSYTYNDRGLVTGISFSGPAPVPAPISYGYDAAGNRTVMSDETGSVTYQYDQLSRLTSEIRQFTGGGVPPGSYSLSYEYNLAGELKAITDPAGSRVDYAFDSTGRLTNVTGSGANSAPIYASNIGYRAWGAIKNLDFGNGVHQHLSFNSRLQNTSLALNNVNTAGTMNWSYEYYADSKLSRVTDSADARFDRFFDYDHEGRIASALTGSEARGGTTADGPFKQTYQYDVWENTTARTYRVWTQGTQSESVSYPNNRHQNWSYDNAGSATATYDANFGYDAAGRNTNYTSNVTMGGLPALEVAHTFDGNSAPAAKTETRREDAAAPAAVTVVFYLRSTALGGKVVAELDSTGYKRKGYIYAGGVPIAEQDISNPGYGSQVNWLSISPATGSEYKTDTSRYVARKEIDPLGADVTSEAIALSVDEPPFYKSNFDYMPMEYEWGPSDEVAEAMSWWEEKLAITAKAIKDRDAAQQAWQSGDRSKALEIIHNNPNVGVQDFDGGNLFGRDAIKFLNGVSRSNGLQSLRVLIIVGDPGENRPELGPGHNHNVGDAFDRVAATKQIELEEVGYEVIVKRASNVGDFASAMTGNGMLDGVEYIGHARNNMLFIGEKAGKGTNLDHSNYTQLSNANLTRDAYIKVNGCNAAAGQPVQMAQWLANWLGRSVGAYDGPTHFSTDKNARGTSPRGQAPRGPRLYMVEDPGTRYVIIRPG